MAESAEAILAYWKEQREQLRQSENQRAILTNFVLAITAAISGFIIQQHFNFRTLPLSIFIVIIGLYGALASAKYHERANYHLFQARAFTQVLIDRGLLADNEPTLEKFRQSHYRVYPRMHKMRLNWLWTGLHLGVSIYGATLFVITLVIRLPTATRTEHSLNGIS